MEPRRVIGKYRIVEQIGRGGMGTVFKAVDETLDRPVAIKMINADLVLPERMQRFRSEAITLARLNHPRIAMIHELMREDDDLFMVMEFVAGESCEKLLAQSGAMPLDNAIELCDQVLDALEHAHQAGIVHRDLKPSNIMVTPARGVKVMDFGIARIAGTEHLTTDGYLMGTPAYMAPEQVRGTDVDSRSDLYSAAVVLYRLLTHRLPFRADTAIGIIQSHLMDQPTPVREVQPDLPPWIDGIFARGLAKPPEERFQTAAEFREALARGLRGDLATAGTHATMMRPAFDATSAETYAAPTPASILQLAASTPASTPPLTPAPTPTPTLMATPVAPTPVHHETSVTLRAPHLAIAGTLLALLVIGVGALAYAALGRPIPMITHAEPAPAAAPPLVMAPAQPPAETPETPAGAPAGTPARAAEASPVPGPASPPPAGSKTGESPVRTDPPKRDVPPVATASNDASPKGAPSNAASSKRDASSVATASNDASAKGAASSAAAASAAAAGAGTPGVDESAPTESFGDVRTVVPQGADNAKGRELDALLSLEPGKLVVRSRDSGSVLKSMPYRAVVAVTAAQSKRPKGSAEPAVAAIPENFAGSTFFLGSAKHWLVLQSKADFLILRLDEKNVHRITTALESRTGVKTQLAPP